MGKVCQSHLVCSAKFKADANFLTYYSTHSLTKLSTEVERLVIVIHGALRNGHTYFDDTVIAAAKLGLAERTLIVAPTFRKVTDAREQGEVYWGRRWYQKWKYGYDSEDSDHISSFELIDRMIESIGNSDKFPNLKAVVVTGHSAGGQFTQRYAVGTTVSNKISQTFTIVPSNPSSYMYLDSDRYHFTDSNYQTIETPTDCSEYNHYIYGPLNRAEYLSKFSVAKLKENFAKQKVIYLMSEKDTGTDSLDRSCEAMLQGKNRFQRAKNFYHYIKKNISKNQHRFYGIPSIGHDHVKVYQSLEASKVIFGNNEYLSNSYLYRKIGEIRDIEKKSLSQFILLGGGRNESTGIRTFLKGVNAGNLLVISGKANLNHRYTHDFWNIAEESGIPLKSVETISFLNSSAGENDFVLSKIRKAEGIFFTGGDQSKYINRIKGTSAHREILKKVREGVSIAGTSAGLAIMGEFIFSAERGGLSSRYVLKNPHSEYITLEHGFFESPLLKNLITDTHFSERNRQGRLLGFMFKTQFKYQIKDLFGVGIDEEASLTFMQNGNMIAAGKGLVTFYRAPNELPKQQHGSLNYGPVSKTQLLRGQLYPHFTKLEFSRTLEVDAGIVLE
ncbi:MAG: cyanophycinase [Halobacteriovoraceae bacterium]|nr:cyanophycinase [Halobacteriovoraceae bacterium]MBT5092828.1 cyanophycinase [Halobacteriovoraceae bacterium]